MLMYQSSRSHESSRHDYRGCSTRIDAQLNREVYTAWREKALNVRDATGANQTFAIQHVGANMARQGALKGGNPLNIPSGDMQCKQALDIDIYGTIFS